MTLRKRTLSIGLLAASLMLAAPAQAQAETWSCSYIDDQIPRTWVFIRTKDKSNGSYFQFYRHDSTFKTKHGGGAAQYKIILENRHGIHLYRMMEQKGISSGGLDAVILSKKLKLFGHVEMWPHRDGITRRGREGSCDISS